MYELLDRIAVGGMAEIYLAREAGAEHGSPDEHLVVKRILPDLADDKRLVAMFLDEQRMAATLDHPNIVRTYNVGEVDGKYFISMEYLAGQDLREISRALKRRRLLMPLELALTIVTGAARGLHYAHEKTGGDRKPLHLVHRDVTPHNLFVTYDGAIKLLDFGVAKAANSMGRTSIGTIKGKVPYMSPEQCRGEPPDRRTDIYALGVVLYEISCGVRLYRSSQGSEYQLMQRIIDEPVPAPSSRRPDYPATLEQIVLRALTKHPADRYHSAEEFGDDLDGFARSHCSLASKSDVARFMAELFRSEVDELRSAGGDIAGAIHRNVARHRRHDPDDPDTSPSGDFIHSMNPANAHRDDPAPGRRGANPSLAAVRSTHNGLSGSLRSVWGAAEPSGTHRLPGSTATRGVRHLADHLSKSPGLLAPSKDPERPSASMRAASAPLAEAAPGVDTTTGAGGVNLDRDHSAPAGARVDQRARKRPRALAPAGTARSAEDQATQRLPIALWLGLLVVGMSLAFWLGTLF